MTNENDTAEMSIEVVDVTLSTSQLSRVYSEPAGAVDPRDVIVAVRKKYPDPWTPVRLQFNGVVSETELEKANIFVKSSEKIDALAGVGRVYFVLSEGEDLEQNAVEYEQLYGVAIDSVLFSYNANDVLSSVWDSTRNTKWEPLLQFPVSFSSTLRKLPDGLDVSVYAKEIQAKERRNSLTDRDVLSVLSEIYKEVDSGKVKLQNLEDTRTRVARWLTLCVTLKKNLTPLYLNSYVAEYLENKIIYPMSKLSFYERYVFTRSVPQIVGYIGVSNEVKVTLNVIKRVAPNPVLVFDMENRKILPDGMLAEFTLSMDKAEAGLAPMDYRTLFKQSAHYWTGSSGSAAAQESGVNSTALANTTDNDEAVDYMLREVFFEMIQKSSFPVYPSIRNTALVQKNGRLYVAYFPEEFGLVAQLSSEIFGVGTEVVKEWDFHRLVSAPVVLACNLLDGVSDSALDSELRVDKASKALAMPQLLRPAVDPAVITAVELAGAQCTGLSYYDYHLRCDPQLFPVVFYDDQGDKTAGIFDYIGVQQVVSDEWAKKNITAFGGISVGQDGTAKLNLSYQSFRRCRLLE